MKYFGTMLNCIHPAPNFFLVKFIFSIVLESPGYFVVWRRKWPHAFVIGQDEDKLQHLSLVHPKPTTRVYNTEPSFPIAINYDLEESFLS